MRIGYARVSTRDQNADDQTPHSGGGRLKSRQSRGPAARQAAQAQPAQLVALHQAGERTISELEELFSATRSTVYRATPAAGPAPLPDPDSEGRDTGAGVPTFPGISFGRSGPTPSAHSTAADCSSSATGSSAQTRASGSSSGAHTRSGSAAFTSASHRLPALRFSPIEDQRNAERSAVTVLAGGRVDQLGQCPGHGVVQVTARSVVPGRRVLAASSAAADLINSS